jgi:phospholipid/cholesterol/gamma-HCH transport system substrate-binding protein
MKFKIRFADQIVGFFIILSLLSLGFVIAMLGRSQRWFARDLAFTTTFYSASGLSKNMAVQYRGFTIGSVKDFFLNDDDNVDVIFIIHEEYTDRVREGSIVELMVSPIGLGNQFLFHAGRGDVLDEGSFVPAFGTAQARQLMRQGLAEEHQRDDSINLLMSRANSILEQVNRLLTLVNVALGRGTDFTEIGQIVGSVRRTLTGVEVLPNEVNQLLRELRMELAPILANLNEITTALNNPDGLVHTVMDTEREVYTSLVSSLSALSGILTNLDRTTAFIPDQLPGLIGELRQILRNAEDVLIAVTNNPLLRGGVPERPEHRTTGPRDIGF